MQTPIFLKTHGYENLSMKALKWKILKSKPMIWDVVCGNWNKIKIASAGSESDVWVK